MFFAAASLLLVVRLSSVSSADFPGPDVNCDFYDAVMSSQPVEVESPEWPSTYKAGVTCRWTIDCPREHSCGIQCYDVGLPQSRDCFIDQLLVSPTGSPTLRGADVYCGNTVFASKSLSSRITLGLKAGRRSPGGRFRCLITAEIDTNDDLYQK